MPRRLRNGQSAGNLAPCLLQKVALSLRRNPNKDWEALFRRIAETPSLNGTPFRRKYSRASHGRKRGSPDFEDSFKATLLWVLDPKNMADIEAGHYDEVHGLMENSCERTKLDG